MAEDKKPKTSVADYRNLLNQYGQRGMDSKSSTAAREAYQKAKADYLKQSGKEDISYKDFKNIYTSKVEDEDNITPWQERARKDEAAAQALAEQEYSQFRKQQAEDFGALDANVRERRGVKAFKALGEIGTLPDDIAQLVKYHQHEGGDHGAGAIKDEDFQRVTSYLESQGGRKNAAKYQKVLQDLYSPLKKKDIVSLYSDLTDDDIVESPLKRVADLSNVYGNQGIQNYATMSQRIGSSVDQAVAEQRAREQREMEEMRRAQQDEMRQLQLGEMKAKQAESLIVPADSGFNSIDTVINQTSRSLVDQAGALTAELKNGDLTTDEYATKLATIRSQVPALKKFKDTLTGNIQAYQQALQSGQLSNAQPNSTDDFYMSLINNAESAQLGIGDDGQVTFQGKTQNGEPFSIPASGIEQMPKPKLKAPSAYETLKEPMTQLANSGGDFDLESAKGQLDGYLQNGGEDALMSLAVDHYGYSLEEAQRLSKEFDGSESKLEQAIESQWVDDAKMVYDTEILKRREQELKVAAQQARIDQLKRAEHQNSQALIQQQEQAKARHEFLQQSVGNKDLGSFVGIGGAARVQTNTQNPRKQALLNAQGKRVLEIDWGKPQEAYARLQNFMTKGKGTGEGGYQDPHQGIFPTTSPVKKNSPLNKDKDPYAKFKSGGPNDPYAEFRSGGTKDPYAKYSSEDKPKGWWDMAKEYSKKGLDFLGLLPKDTSDEALGLSPDQFTFINDQGEKMVDFGAYQNARNQALGYDENVHGAANPFLGGPAGGAGKAAKAASKLKAPSSWGKRAGAEFKFSGDPVKDQLLNSGDDLLRYYGNKFKNIGQKDLHQIINASQAQRAMGKIAQQGALGKNKYQAAKAAKKIANDLGVTNKELVKDIVGRAKTERFAANQTWKYAGNYSPEDMRNIENVTKWGIGGIAGGVGASKLKDALD